jgi:two-component system sensor histidine kinase/response regulator
MLKNLTISTKTGLGFGLILLVMAAMVAFAFRGLQGSSESFATYRRLARSSVLSGRVQANMLMASKAAKDFLKSRDDKHLEIYDKRFASAQTFALEQQTTMEDSQRRELSENLVSQLGSYQRANQEVFQLMRRRDIILQQTLNPQGIRMRKNLTNIMVSANLDEDSEAAYLAGRTLERVLLGRLYMFKFLEDNRESDAERVRQELGSGFEKDFDAFVAAIDDPQRKSLLQDFSTARAAYIEAFEEMVSTIQRRNELIAQDVEPLDQSIADVSEQIKLSLKADQDDLGPSVQKNNANTVRTVLVGSLVAIGLAVLIALLFVRTVNKSVAALGLSEAETERLASEISARQQTERKLASAMEEVKRVNFLSDIALELTECGYWHVDYSDPDYYYQSERAARILGEPLRENGRYHLQDEWFARLEEADPDTAALTGERYEGAVEGRYENYDSTYAYKRPVDGEIIWVHALGQIVRDGDGNTQYMYGVYQDVTQRVRAEQSLNDAKEHAEEFAAELQRSRALNQGLLDATESVVYVKDVDGHYMLVNNEWCRVMDRSAEETVGQTDFDIQPPDVANALAENDRRVIEFQKPLRFEETPDGGPEPRTYISNKFPLFDGDGNVYAIGGISTDISELKRHEEALRKSEERFDLTVRGSGDGLWDHDPATGEMWFSNRFRELLGYRNEEEYPNVAESWSDGLYPDDREATLQAFAAHLERDVPYDVEYRLKTKTGPYRWYRARGISLRDETGRSYRAAGSITDITDQKQAKLALAAAEQRSRLLLESAPDGIMIANDRGHIVMVNARFEALFGFTKDEIVGQPIEILLPERFRAKHVGQRDTFFSHSSVREMGSGMDLFARRKDGSEFPVEISLSPLQTDDGILVSSSIRDITERKRAEAELVEARTAAEAANQAKSDFLANMSHEIRTPMNGIMGMTELALGTDLSKEQQEFLTTIESSAESLLSLINDILDFSKIEAKKLDLDPVDFELRERIGETLSTLAARAHDKGLELAFDVDPGVPESLVGDVHRIRQILVNLLGNAIKFTERGEIVLRIELVRQADQTVTLRFAVKDTGIGLPPEKIETIFQPFEQADLSTTRKYGGTGLGLAICVRLVELMGGELQVDSKLGQGTTFSFTADLQIGEHMPLKHVTSPPRELRGLRVLVIDDNETNRRILARMLENWGMDSVVVDSGAKGLQALQASLDDQPIGLVLSDVNMPEMDGFMFAQQVKDDQGLKNTPIILLTSANRSGDSALCRQLGIAAHLIKPARQSLLFDAIATSVGVGGAEEKTSNDGAVVQPPDPASQGLRLLLAEDNATNQKFAVRSLTKAGHTVVVANNGQEAVEAWTAETFDAVLMDIQMPIMDGYDATGEIRRREATSSRHTPIIAMTAHAMKGDKEKCLEAGMNGYVTKPIKSKFMLAEIARVLKEFPQQRDSGSRQEPIDD